MTHLCGFSHLTQIVDKALEEPKYSSLYAQLCLRLAEDAPNFDGPSSEIQSTQKQSTVSELQYCDFKKQKHKPTSAHFAVIY